MYHWSDFQSCLCIHYRCKCGDNCQNPYGSKNWQDKSNPENKEQTIRQKRDNHSKKLPRIADKDFYEQQNVAITKSIWNLQETLLLLHLYPLHRPWERNPPISKTHLVFERFQELYGRLADGEEENKDRLNLKKKTISQFRSKIGHLLSNFGIYNRNNISIDKK